MEINVHFDLETNDPDDIFALCILATHPRVNLVSVTIFPGGTDQVGLVKHVLGRLNRDDVKIGANNLCDGKLRVSPFHYHWLGKIKSATAEESPEQVITYTLEMNKPVTLVTGAPLRNIHRALKSTNHTFDSWVAQGGFAGDNVVPPEDRLEKFDGKLTCPTFNFNGDPKAAKYLLDESPIPMKKLVSKNVCHGIIHDQDAQNRFPSGVHPGLDLLLDGMESYFKKRPEGKALHDVLAVGLLLDPDAAQWARVKIYRERGQWGAIPVEQDGVFITTKIYRQRLEQALIQ
jgi:pyrimidine-specific ribonucleoside hydrolase